MFLGTVMFPGAGMVLYKKKKKDNRKMKSYILFRGTDQIFIITVGCVMIDSEYPGAIVNSGWPASMTVPLIFC